MPEALRGLHEAPEVLERAELRMDRGVAALGAADGPGAARIAGPGGQRVVRALARGAADGMDGRQVDDVEAHAPDLGEPLDAVGEGAVAAGDPALGAREQLVPGREGGRRPVHHHLELPVVAGAGPGRGWTRAITWRSSGSRSTSRRRSLRGRGLEPLERAAPARPRPRSPRGLRARARASRRLRAARWRDRSARRPCGAASPRPRSRRYRSTPPRCSDSAYWPRAGTCPAQPSLSTGRSGASRQSDSPAARYRIDAARRSWPSLKMSAETVDDVAHDALDRIPAVVHRGTHVLDHDRAAATLAHRQRSTR